MPQTITGLNSYASAMTTVSAGDPAVAATIRANLQTLLNNTTYLNTALLHQAADDRGGTHVITNPIVWNDGGGSFTVQIDSSFHNLDVIGDFHVHDEGEFQVFSQATFMSHANFADVVEMASTLTVRGAAEFRDDVLLGFNSDDEIEVRGEFIINNNAAFHDDVQLGFDDGDAITVGGVLVANEAVTIHGTLTTTGNSHIGNAGADTHEITGDVTLNDGLSVAEDASFAADVAVDGNVDVQGNLVVHDTIELLGDVALGGASSDDITFNGKIITPVGFQGAGRIGYRYVALPNTTPYSVNVSMGNLFFANNRTFPSQITISDAGAADGDFMEFVTDFNLSFSVGVQTPDGKNAVLNSIGEWVKVVRMNGTWYFFRTQDIPVTF